MKASEIKELTKQELLERIDNEKGFLIRQKLNHAVSPLENPLKIRDTRRNIARLLSELNSRSKSNENSES